MLLINSLSIRARSRIFRQLKCVATLGLGLFALNACSINPATGTPNFVFMSESEEIKIGRETHEKIVASTPIYKDEALNAYINEVGQRVAKTSDRPDLNYTFTIIDSPDINAFALPGGYIYVNRGLIAYLQSEAQLAAVLGHEIGHVTARHAVRRDAAQKGAGLLGFISVVATGSYVVGDVANLWTSAAVMGYGREMELEADKFGAEYLLNAKYDPQAMVEVISVLKDQERFSRLKEKDQGKRPQTYHGVFASHPRNDTRLREIIDEAGKLAASEEADANEQGFREQTEGLVFGINYDMTLGDSNEPNRFSHQNLGFTLLFPEGWEVANQRSAIVATAPENAAELKIEVDVLRANIAPSEYIRGKLGVKLLKKSEPFSQGGLIGHTGIVEDGAYQKRIAVLYQANRVYIFTGTVKEAKADTDYDKLFLDSIHSFRGTRVVNAGNQQSQKIHYVRANERTTFAALAQLSPLRQYAEQELRLLNGYYPSGEPRPGEWIKIIK